MKTIALDELQHPLDTLINEARPFEVIVVTSQGEPIAEIMRLGKPVSAHPADESEHPPGSPAGILEFLRKHPFPEGSRRTPEQIRRDLEEERNSWD